MHSFMSLAVGSSTYLALTSLTLRHCDAESTIILAHHQRGRLLALVSTENVLALKASRHYLRVQHRCGLRRAMKSKAIQIRYGT